MEQMTNGKVRHVLLIDQEVLVGIVAIGGDGGRVSISRTTDCELAVSVANRLAGPSCARKASRGATARDSASRLDQEISLTCEHVNTHVNTSTC